MHLVTSVSLSHRGRNSAGRCDSQGAIIGVIVNLHFCVGVPPFRIFNIIYHISCNRSQVPGSRIHAGCLLQAGGFY